MRIKGKLKGPGLLSVKHKIGLELTIGSESTSQSELVQITGKSQKYYPYSIWSTYYQKRKNIDLMRDLDYWNHNSKTKLKGRQLFWDVKRPLAVNPDCMLQLKTGKADIAMYYTFTFSYGRVYQSGRSQMMRVAFTDLEEQPRIGFKPQQVYKGLQTIDQCTVIPDEKVVSIWLIFILLALITIAIMILPLIFFIRSKWLDYEKHE